MGDLAVKKVMYGTVALFAGIFVISSPVLAEESDTGNTDVNLTINTVIALSLANCDSSDGSAVNLTIKPSAVGVFNNNCQILSIGTNAPGYELSVKASGSHPALNSGAITNSLIYQNPLPPNITVPPIVPSTSNPLSAPLALTNNTWGFAVTSSNVSLASTPMANFDSSYTLGSAGSTGKYANMPTTDITLYHTLDLPGQIDAFTFYYGARVTSDKLAGLYQTMVTYTAVGEEIPVPLFHWKQISVGGGHTCAIGSDDFAYCWGGNYYGQLGDGTMGNKTLPTIVKGSLTDVAVKEISSGADHTCAITTAGAAFCWGWDNYGQTGFSAGLGLDQIYPVPVGSPMNANVKQISAGTYHTCAISESNQAYCWGSNSAGQLGSGLVGGYGSYIRTPNPVIAPLNTNVKQIVAGLEHTCALTISGQVWCWGSNNEGWLGNNGVYDYCTTGALNASDCFDEGGEWIILTGIPSMVDISPVSGLYNKTVDSITSNCALTTTGQVYCWGSNGMGQVGDNQNSNHCSNDWFTNEWDCLNYYGSTTWNQYSPIPVAVDVGSSSGLFGKTTKSISGNNPVCAIDTTGAVSCWGWLSYYFDGFIPVALGSPLNSGIKQVSSGSMVSNGGSACALTETGVAYCWNAANNTPVIVDTTGL